MTDNYLYLIYDGHCPLCSYTSKKLIIQRNIGKVITIDARSDHPLVNEVNSLGYKLNEGIVVKYQGNYYHGADGLNFLALISTPSNGFNRLVGLIFRHKTTSKLLYPLLKSARKILLFVHKKPAIKHPAGNPLIKSIFPEDFSALPEVLQKRYSSRPYSNDTLHLQGHLDVKFSKLYAFFSPLFRLTGALVPYQGHHIITQITFQSNEDSEKISMDRQLRFPQKQSQFKSYISVTNDNLVIEWVKFGMGLKMHYCYEDNKISMQHAAYVFNLFGFHLPLPLSLLFGKFYFEETAIDLNNFSMKMHMQHPLFGKLFEYAGNFTVLE